jgi:hypothetical protein
MAAETEFPTFANEKTTSCSLFIAFTGLKTLKKLPQIVHRLANEFLKFKMVKNIYF